MGPLNLLPPCWGQVPTETKPFVTLLSVPTGVSIPLCVPRLDAVQDESCPRAAPGVVGVRGFASGLHLLMLPGLLRLGQESSWPHGGDVSLLQPQTSGAGGTSYPLNAGSTPSINLVGWGLSPQHHPAPIPSPKPLQRGTSFWMRGGQKNVSSSFQASAVLVRGSAVRASAWSCQINRDGDQRQEASVGW